MRGWLYPMDGAHPLGETGKRAAERAQRAETPSKNPAYRIRQRYQSSGVHAAATGLHRSAWRKLAETGGNSLQKLCSRNCLVSSKGWPPRADWRNACGNCGNCHLTHPGARASRAVPTNLRTTSSWMVAASTIWTIGTDSLAAWPWAPDPGPKLMISMPSSA